MDKQLNNSHNTLDNKDSLGHDNADKKRPNPWQDDSGAKRFSGSEEDKSKNNASKPSVTSVGHTSQISTSINESLILLANDKVPVRNQLEGVLSHILRSVQDQITLNLKEIPINQAKDMQHLVKQIICDRIKRLMLDNQVGSNTDIVAAYHAKYPPETDENMLKAVLETLKSSSKYIEADSAEEFFELNLQHILQSKLNEMFEKLEEIYSDLGGPLNDTDLRIDNKATYEKNDPKIDRDENAADSDISNNGEISTLSVEQHDNILKSLLLKMVPYLTRIMNLDYSHESRVADIVLKTENLKTVLIKESEHDVSNPVNEVSEDNKENTGDKEIISSECGKPLTSSPLLYVKVVARPTLPIKEKMKTFLNQFTPKCVKKHKKQHNLLFVGFSDKKSVDDIISKNGITIGECSIEVTAIESTANKFTDNNVNRIEKCKNTKTGSDCKNVSSDVDTVTNTEVSQVKNIHIDSAIKIASPDNTNGSIQLSKISSKNININNTV